MSDSTSEWQLLFFNCVASMTCLLPSGSQRVKLDSNWITEHGYDKLFGYSGVQQFVLDIHALLKICDAFITPAITKSANEACSRALKIYFKRAKDTSLVLKVCRCFWLKLTR